VYMCAYMCVYVHVCTHTHVHIQPGEGFLELEEIDHPQVCFSTYYVSKETY
jgi:hypothetical protein